MITIQINNITFKVELISNECEGPGFCSIWKIPIMDWKVYASQFCDGEIPYLIFDTDELNYYLSKDDEYCNIFQPDIYICYLSDVIEKSGNYEIYVKTDDISWIWHDYYHAVHHCNNYSIQVIPSWEEETLLYGIEEAYKFNDHLPEYEYILKLENDFFSRFRKRINLLSNFWEAINEEKETMGV